MCSASQGTARGGEQRRRTVTLDADVTLAGGLNTLDRHRVRPTPAFESLTVGTNTNLYNVDLTVTVTLRQAGLLGGRLGPTLGSLVLTGHTNSTNAADSETFVVPPTCSV